MARRLLQLRAVGIRKRLRTVQIPRPLLMFAGLITASIGSCSLPSIKPPGL